MTISDSYQEYSRQLTDRHQPGLLYRGEAMVRNLWPSAAVAGGNVWALWLKADGMECCRALRHGDTCSICSIASIPDIVDRAQLDTPGVMEWLNLCHHRDDDGHVRYDAYYDRFAVSDTSALTLGELRSAVDSKLDRYLPAVAGDTIIVDGQLAQCNMLRQRLQARGINVVAPPPVSLPPEIEGSATRMPFYTVGADGIMVVEVSGSRQFALYDDAGTMRLCRTGYDLTGNMWLAAANPDGTVSHSRIAGGQVNFEEKNTQNSNTDNGKLSDKLYCNRPRTDAGQ